jgi:hypothetical protein
MGGEIFPFRLLKIIQIIWIIPNGKEQPAGK